MSVGLVTRVARIASGAAVLLLQPAGPLWALGPASAATNSMPAYISGQVLRDDGAPIEEPVAVEEVCGGGGQIQGYSDRRGYFHLQLGSSTQYFQDASNSGSDPLSNKSGSPAPGGLADRDSSSCEIRAKASGFRSQAVLERRGDVGVILIHLIQPSEGDLVSMASLRAPKAARKAYQKGLEAAKKGKQQKAVESFKAAVAAYPGYSSAWLELGKVLLNQQDRDGARGSFTNAIQAEQHFVPPYVYAASLAITERNWPDAVKYSSEAISLTPFDYPQAFLFNAVAHFQLHQFDDAEKSAREVLRLDKQHQMPLADELLGIMLARRREYAEAVDHFRAYLEYAPSAQDALSVRAQIAGFERLSARAAGMASGVAN